MFAKSENVVSMWIALYGTSFGGTHTKIVRIKCYSPELKFE